MSTRRILSFLCGAGIFTAALLLCTSSLFHAASDYHVIRNILLGGAGAGIT